MSCFSNMKPLLQNADFLRPWRTLCPTLSVLKMVVSKAKNYTFCSNKQYFKTVSLGSKNVS